MPQLPSVREKVRGREQTSHFFCVKEKKRRPPKVQRNPDWDGRQRNKQTF